MPEVVKGTLVGVATLLFVAAILFLIGADLDNGLGLLTARHTNRVLGYRSNQGSLRESIDRAYVVTKVSARHREELLVTIVDIDVVDRETREATTLSWEVGQNLFRPSSLFPLTREAAVLSPELLPPEVLPEYYPSTSARLMTSTAVQNHAAMIKQRLEAHGR